MAVMDSLTSDYVEASVGVSETPGLMEADGSL